MFCVKCLQYRKVYFNLGKFCECCIKCNKKIEGKTVLIFGEYYRVQKECDIIKNPSLDKFDKIIKYANIEEVYLDTYLNFNHFELFLTSLYEKKSSKDLSNIKLFIVDKKEILSKDMLNLIKNSFKEIIYI